MNLVLLEPDELTSSGVALLRGRRARHILEVHRATVGDELRVAVVGGLIGRGTIRAASLDEVVVEIVLDQPPPPRLAVDLLLAMPRPKILKRVLPAATSMGVKRIVLVNAARVEKSYFDSPMLRPDELRTLMLLGLEQARDTVLPEVLIRERFRPFVEDETDVLWPAPIDRLVAHPTAPTPVESLRLSRSGAVLAIGPEGGWVPFEVDLLHVRGFHGFSLGARILRVDTAVPAIVAQIDLLRRLATT